LPVDRLDVVGDLVGGRPRVGHLVVDDGVDAEHEVVLGDHRLRCERHDLLAQVDHLTHAVDHRHQDHEPGGERSRIAAQPLNDAGSCLGDYTHRPSDHDQQRKNAYGGDNCLNHFVLLTGGRNHLSPDQALGSESPADRGVEPTC
jgi:hypothetical protein